MSTLEQARTIAAALPRSYEAVVRDRLKFRVGRIVYAAFAHDESMMGFAFPKLERDALVTGDPAKFLLPRERDLRYNWVVVRLAAIDEPELREILTDAWRMVVPQQVSEDFVF